MTQDGGIRVRIFAKLESLNMEKFDHFGTDKK